MSSARSTNRRTFIKGLGAAAATAAVAPMFSSRTAHAASPPQRLPQLTSVPAILMAYRQPLIHNINDEPFQVTITEQLTYQNAGDGRKVKQEHAPTASAALQSLVAAHIAAAEWGSSEAYVRWVRSVIDTAVTAQTKAVYGSSLLVPAARLIGNVHTGKGSPRHLSAVLTLVHYYVKHNMLNPALLVPPGTPSIHEDRNAFLRAYVARNVGLDCNGFVGNAARELGLSRSPQNPTQGYATKAQRNAVFGLNGVTFHDVIRFKNISHVALIYGLSPIYTGFTMDWNAVHVAVAESVGDVPYNGLTHTPYSTLRHVGGNEFQFTRQGQKHVNTVFVAPLDSIEPPSTGLDAAQEF
jgi:hypothetical protein